MMERIRKFTVLCLSISATAVLSTSNSTAIGAEGQRKAQLEPADDGAKPTVITVAPAAGELADFEGTKGRTIYQYRDEKTQQVIKIGVPEASQEQLRKSIPSHMTKRLTDFEIRNANETDMRKYCNQKVSLLNEMMEELPAEVIAFYIAMMTNATLATNNDPAAMVHGFQDNVLDPVNLAALTTYMIANRSIQTAFKVSGIVFDPCRHPRKINYDRYKGKNGLTVKPEPPANPNRLQRVTTPLFKPLLPYFGVSAGLVASSLVSEIWNDKDLGLCAAGLYKNVDPEKRAEACDRAYYNWTLSRKIVQYLPSIFVGIGSHFAITAATNMFYKKFVKQVSAKGAEVWVPVLLRGLRIGWQVRHLSKFTFGFIVNVAGETLFWFAQNYATPFVVKPVQTVYTANQIQNLATGIRDELKRAENSQWKWEPKEKKFCTDPLLAEASLGQNSGAEYDCSDTTHTIPWLLRRYGDTMENWRRFLLEAPMQRYSQWEDYVLDFEQMYSAAYIFGGAVSDAVARQNRHLQKIVDKETSKPTTASALFARHPLNGVFTPQETAEGELVANTSAEGRKIALDATIAYLDSVSKDEKNPMYLGKDDRKKLETIRRGLVTAREALELPKTNESGAMDSQIEVDEAMRLWEETLAHDRTWTDRGYLWPSEMYNQRAKSNPFMAIRVLLGNPTPLHEGIAALEKLEEEIDGLAQEGSKLDFPTFVPRRVKAKSMTEYLLARAVCAEDTESVVVKIPMTSVKLRPPRLLQPVLSPNGREIKFCNQFPSGAGFRQIETSLYRPLQGEWLVGDRRYFGFLDLLKYNLRPELFDHAKTESRFDGWWSARMDSDVRAAVDGFQRDYQSMLEDTFYPVLTGEKSSSLMSLGNWLNRKTHTEEIKVAVQPSLVAQAEYYLRIIESVHLSRFTGDQLKKERTRVDEAKALVLKHLTLMSRLVDRPSNVLQAIKEIETWLKIPVLKSLRGMPLGELRERRGNAFRTSNESLQKLMDELKGTLITKSGPEGTANMPANRRGALSAEQNRNEIIAVALEIVANLAAEANTYMNVVSAAYVDKLDRQAAPEKSE